MDEKLDYLGLPRAKTGNVKFAKKKEEEKERSCKRTCSSSAFVSEHVPLAVITTSRGINDVSPIWDFIPRLEKVDTLRVQRGTCVSRFRDLLESTTLVLILNARIFDLD